MALPGIRSGFFSVLIKPEGYIFPAFMSATTTPNISWDEENDLEQLGRPILALVRRYEHDVKELMDDHKAAIKEFV